MKLPHRRQFLHLTAGAAALPAVSRIARAQAYPSRPVSIIVPFPAGGPTDTLARILADRMRAALGQSIIVENPTGAGGTIGTARAARAAPDGYTVILGHWQTHVVNAATYSLPFDVVSDFEPISLVADCPTWLVGRKTLAPKGLKELVAWLKANPDKATVGIPGVGGGADVVGTYFQRDTGTRFQYVPYRGGAPMVQDLVAGQIDLSFTMVASSLQQVRNSDLKAYAVMAKTRWWAAGRHADIRRSRRTRALLVVLARPVGPQGHAEACHNQASCRAGGDFSRSDRPSASGRDRPGHVAARAANAGGTRRAAEGRD
jgi:tripartite-type tricarboxylate transporter receptor subunit TctC